MFNVYSKYEYSWQINFPFGRRLFIFYGRGEAVLPRQNPSAGGCPGYEPGDLRRSCPAFGYWLCARRCHGHRMEAPEITMMAEDKCWAKKKKRKQERKTKFYFQGQTGGMTKSHQSVQLGELIEQQTGTSEFPWLKVARHLAIIWQMWPKKRKRQGCKAGVDECGTKI